MKNIINIIWNFINNFDKHPYGLFLYGKTGVGKTYISHCIAKELIDKQYCVLYFSSYDFFDILAKNILKTNINPFDMVSFIYNCDLLIIDDLGNELVNNFVISQLFNCIEKRIINNKSTIIITNLIIKKFFKTYNEHIFSRISNNYIMLKLIGNDIRIKKNFYRRTKHVTKEKNNFI